MWLYCHQKWDRFDRWCPPHSSISANRKEISMRIDSRKKYQKIELTLLLYYGLDGPGLISLHACLFLMRVSYSNRRDLNLRHTGIVKYFKWELNFAILKNIIHGCIFMHEGDFILNDNLRTSHTYLNLSFPTDCGLCS